MGSKDTTKSVIHKPETQKKPNLTPRKTKSSNWCPDLHHKAPKRAQSHPTEHQMGPKRLPRGRPGHQESAKWPNWGFNGCPVAPEGLPGDPKKHPKWAQAWETRPHGKNYVQSHYSHEEITYLEPKTSKTLPFCLPVDGHFWCILWKPSKTLVFSTFFTSEIGKITLKTTPARMNFCRFPPQTPPSSTFVPPGD